MIAAALLSAALLAAQAPDPPAAPPRASTSVGARGLDVDAARAPTLVIRTRGLDEDAVRDALRPRAGGAHVVLLRDAAGVDPDHTFLDVALGPDALQISIILADGRVFARAAPAPAGPRDAARLVATMLAAIAGAALDPLPERGHSPALDPPARDVAADLPLDVPVPEDLPFETLPEDPVPEDLSPEPPPERADLEPEARAPPPVAPRARPGLGLALDAGPLLGLGAPTTGLVAGAAGIGLLVRGVRPWLVAATLRVAHREADQFALTRLRVGLTAGAWLRRGRFELRATAGLGVEPWLITRLGRRVTSGAGTPASVLVGGHLRVVPSVALPGARLGLVAELAASAAPTGRAVQILLTDARLFALGGLEATLGLELHFDLVAASPRSLPQ